VKRRVGQPAWRRIPSGLRYLRSHGLIATWYRLFPGPRTYASWVDAFDTLRSNDVKAIQKHIRKLSARPLLSVILPVTGTHEPLLGDAVLSVIGQLYPDWELCITTTPQALPAVTADVDRFGSGDRRIKLVASAAEDFATTANAGLAAATGAFVLFLGARDRLAAHALYMIAVELCRHADADVIYSDEDLIDEHGSRNHPNFKSDWNPDLLLGCDMIGHLAAFRRDLVARAGEVRPGLTGTAKYDLALRLTEQSQPDRIHHIPMILYHQRQAADPSTASLAEGMRQAVTEHFERAERMAAVSLSQCHIRIRYPLPVPLPGVSLIIPTRDRADLLRQCVDGLLSKTDYDNIEIVIVDNDSELLETQAYLARLREFEHVRVLSFSGQFNYSAINNFAVNHVIHDIIGFINNDIEVIHPDWLREMVSHVIRPEIGAVGAKLLYPDDTIQHAGTIVGLGGLAGHAFRYFNRDDPGYFDRLRLVQNMSAVTAACMLMRKQVFTDAGGFDAINLPVAYNDVDLCLRVRERGYRNLWTPFAELYHHESGSRASDFAPERIKAYRREMDYLKTRWKDVIDHDPSYNPNLTVEAEDFSPAFPPRIIRPWRR